MRIVLALVLALALPAAAARANQDAPVAEPETPQVTPESRLDAGLALADKKDWAGAEAAFREAIKLRPEFPEAWNNLGHALREQKKYAESVKSYQEALRLRPDYPQALEYLGEAYVEMGKFDDARAVLDRLRPLDPQQAAELAGAIDGRGGSWK